MTNMHTHMRMHTLAHGLDEHGSVNTAIRLLRRQDANGDVAEEAHKPTDIRMWVSTTAAYKVQCATPSLIANRCCYSGM